MKNADEILKAAGILPVVQVEDARQAVPLADALLAGGIAAAEITFRTPAAAKSIEAVANARPDMFVCAGTVLTVEQAKLAAACGAKAVISPGCSPQVVEWCLSHGMPVYPGCATPTEVGAALAYGLTTVKLFPAQAVGGLTMLKALYGPFPQMKFMPTGGISPENLKEYLLQPNVIACGGSWLCPPAVLAGNDWQKITALAKAAADLAAQARRAKA